MFSRVLNLDLGEHPAAFLWGPRKVGKTTFLRQRFPQAKIYDLLQTDLKTTLLIHPERLREELLAAPPKLVIIDEIQKVPALLDEIHWCIENTSIQFILCGSSARKLKHGAANLLGGRAWRFEMFPLTTAEIPTPELSRILNHGLLPAHYAQDRPERSLRAYVLDYLNEEIQAEALVREMPAFARFMDATAISHGELINYTNIASDCGVSSRTVREYYHILEDTLLGFTLPAWRKQRRRRLVETAKFYLFDTGIVRALKGMHTIEAGTVEFGQAFEHFLIQELRAYLSYREKYLPLSFWRTHTGAEVDIIVGDMDLAIECKSTTQVKPDHLKGLRTLMDEQPVKKAFLVSCETTPRKVGNIMILPWQLFCQKLWAGELV